MTSEATWKEPVINRGQPIIAVLLMAPLLILPGLGCASSSSTSSSPTSHSALGAGTGQPASAEGAAWRAASPAEDRAEATSEPLRASVAAWRFGESDGRLISTPNFRIHTTARRSDFVNRLPAFYEAALEHYTSALGDLPPPPRPLQTYLFRNRSQWQMKTAEMLPDQAGVFNTLGRGGFTTGGTAVLYYIDHPRRRGSPDTFAIAAHEGWHQYTQTTFKHHLPIWLEEGIATYMESFSLGREGSPQFRPWTNAERRAALTEAMRSQDLISLAELVRRSPQSFLESGKSSLLTYYAQVWALTRFLVEWEDGHYREALEEVLRDAAEGRLVGRLSSSTAITGQRRRTLAATTRSGPWLILEYFNRDFAEFEDQYLAYLRELAQRGR